MDSNLFCILAGLTFFIFGISEISLRFEKIKGGRIERALKKVNSNQFRSLALGAGITVAIQSSTALTEVKYRNHIYFMDNSIILYGL